MLARPVKKITLSLGLAMATVAFPSCLAAQLEREIPSTAPEASTKQDAQNASALPVPPGKRRLSQEIQLTGEETWLDSSIEVRASEHALITPTAKLRYANAKENNA